MNKSGQWGMRLQQAVSFSHPLARMSRTPALFWPGCALMSLDPEILYQTFAVLRRVEPELGFSTCCCGQPTRYLEPGKFSRRQGRLLLGRGILQQGGLRVAYLEKAVVSLLPQAHGDAAAVRVVADAVLHQIGQGAVQQGAVGL